jgi:poly(3-hydroxybutyrate) depolymerase/uncharacterized protein YjdB
MKQKFYTILLILIAIVENASAGYVNGTMSYGGQTRKYVIYVPQIYLNQPKKVPLLVGLHGNGDNAANFSQICMSTAIADTANYIVVYPEALPDPILTTNAWHSGAGVIPLFEVNSTVDDVGFINQLMNNIITGYQIDTNRMYVFGFSFGGFMTNKMAASSAKRFAAAACVAGERGNYNTSIPAVPVPYLHFHGTADSVITYNGTGGSFPALGMTPENTTKFWATQNGCNLTPVVDTMPDLVNDGLRFIRYTYNHPTNTNTNKAILYKVVNGEHDWHYRPNNDLDYCQTIWEFFRRYSKTSSTTPGTPIASFTASDTAVCAGNTITFTSTSTSSIGTLDSIRWTILGGTPSTGTTTPIVSTFNTVGNYIITLKAYKSGNVSTVTKSITVKAIPTVNPLTGTLSVCVGATTTLSSTTAGGTWLSSNTNVATVVNGVVTGVSAGTANIYYTVNVNGCSKSVAAVVTVNALPSISGTLSVCVGDTVRLTGSPTANATTPWTSATASVATITSTGLVTGVSAGTSVITYKNSNGCTKTATITVKALPTVNPLTGTLSVCVGATTTLSSTTAGGTWLSSNTNVATVVNGVVTGVSAGTANIYYTVNVNGCSKSVAAVVTVNALPSISGTLSVCVGDTVRLTGSPTANATTPWTSATPSVATITSTGLVTGVSAGTSVITYKNSNGCTKTATITVKALPTVNPLTGTLSVCVGATTTLSSTTAGGTWLSSNTNVATVVNGVVTGVSAGSANIYYTVNVNGCSKSVAAVVTVNALPNTPVITKVNDTLYASIIGSSYKWYKDGNLIGTTVIPKIKITQNGIYTVEVVGANGCTSLKSASFNVTTLGFKNNKLDVSKSNKWII